MELSKRAAALAASGRDIISMNIGEPDFTAPEPVIAAAAEALRRGDTQYTHALGIPALREAIAAHYREAFGVDVAAERIIVTAGASGALLLACAALVNPGDEILMPDPSYPCNRHFVSAFGGTSRMIPSGPAQRFQLSAADVAGQWRERTRGVLLASPSNPTGTTIDAAELGRIVDIVRARGGVTIVDEIYQGLTYDGPAQTALTLGDDIVTVNSFSKYFAMTGWRLGWIVAPTSWVPAFEKLTQNLFICASAVAQHAALACFTPMARNICEQRRLALKARRDYLVPALKAIGFDVPVIPDGAFYVYADCSGVSHPASQDADALSHALLEEAGVAAVPGLDFGTDAPRRYLRFSYATALPRIEEAVARMDALFKQHR
ncbi:pyridoxal phosphate-dependent aminotransferase [Robbsia sp. KACC 23696]|uniref:pyridoxal phosphate-dependent aminotransferase n=1 Tax=Robbsia sp. KACC 23696 TaxID=3149231 RepID=UPI00325AD260